jgi:hypothetical protein
VELSSQSGDSSAAAVEVTPYDTGWYCLLDQYSGDANYSPVSDNATATQCLHVTGSSSSASERSGAAAWVTPAPPSAAAAAAVAPAPGSRSGPSLVSSIG